MKSKSLIIFILSVLFLASSLSSCAQDDNVSVTETSDITAAAPEEKDTLSYLPKADYEGYEFRMLVRNSERWINDMYVETDLIITV
jgi:hypothetical protein